MSPLQIYSIAAVLCGAIFLGSSYALSRNTSPYIPKKLLGQWLIMEMFILFFLAGYLFFLIVVAKGYSFPVELITSTIFLGGSLFVALVVNLSRITIRRIRSNEEKIKESNRDLNQAYESTIAGWGRALELRDKETEGHTQRVTELTVKLAKKMGLTHQEIVHIRRGALLHDIGKMAISDSILRKDGPLTGAERQEMEKHPEHARAMLAAINYLAAAMDIPYCHHERWDGTGYPQGLKKEAIPLSARIFAVADVWDAIISQRPYHKAWTFERACQHIRSQSGQHFDPQVVDHFLAMVCCCDLLANETPVSEGLEKIL